jgi:UDP-N-acetyl-D-mannosaminuronic acid dehydrogenase
VQVGKATQSMDFSELEIAIEEKTAKLVVIGLGYVGLPVACLFTEAGFPVIGLDVDRTKVDAINQGRCPIQGREPGLPDLVARVVNDGGLRATTDYSVSQDAEIVLIAVETPVDAETKKPRYTALRRALADLAQHLQPGTLVIIESTLAPGTMTSLVQPMLEEASELTVNEDIHLVNCPERVMPGKLLHNLRHMHRVVGGSSPEAADLAVRFYRHVVDADLDPVDCLTAELVKTMENAYRDVQIAFANEMALLCEDLGADAWKVRELVNKSPGRHMLYPGAGVGGHCIPKDPWLLIANASDRFKPRLIPTARAVNDGMPLHMADLTVEALAEAGVDVPDAKVAVLGYAYLADSDDTRNSPTAVLVSRLRELGAEAVIHDPYVREYQGDLEERVRGSDAIVIMVAHDVYRTLDVEWLAPRIAHPVLIDGRGIALSLKMTESGWHRKSVGVGSRVP